MLASGALERPIAFEDNDRPGIMMASAVRTYLNRFGVAPGKRVTSSMSPLIVLRADRSLDAPAGGGDVGAPAQQVHRHRLHFGMCGCYGINSCWRIFGERQRRILLPAFISEAKHTKKQH